MKRVIKIFMTSLALLLLGAGYTAAAQLLLDGSLIPKYVEPLPVAGDITVVDATSAAAGLPGSSLANPLEINATEFQSQILPTPANWPGMPPTCIDEQKSKNKKKTPSSASWTWGYLLLDEDKGLIRPSYLGPVVVAERNVPFYPMYGNKLQAGGYVQQNLPIDMTLDWANPDGIVCGGVNPEDPYTNILCGELPYMGDIPIATHLHGGEVAAAFDGGPDAWFTRNWKQTGSGWPGKVYEYPNAQQESTIWFHDHALGITRLNVYAGLAGAYPIIDPANPPLAAMPAFPAYDIPLILQDRSFDTNCEIFYNLASNPQPNPTVHPFWIPEFIGDTNVVNGKTWPYLDVEPRQYRFRFINGANSRFYNLYLSDGTPFIAIATDDGYIENAFATTELTIGPGERYEVIVDFGEMAAGTVITMMNDAGIPFPDGDPVTADTAEVMQFRVNLPLSAVADTAIADGTAIRPTPIVPIIDAHNPATGSITRQLTLNEIEDPLNGPLELVINNSKFNAASILPGCPTPLCRETELPAVGDTEIWEIINISADAHPMHTHLTSFQIIERIPFNDVDNYVLEYENARVTNGVADGDGPPNQYNELNADGAIGGNPPVSPYLNIGAARGPEPYEVGWKDVVTSYPGEVTRIVVRWAETDAPATGAGAPGPGDNTYPFDPTALVGGVGYVWHCHIIDHEDNEMMRNYVVGNARQPVVAP